MKKTSAILLGTIFSLSSVQSFANTGNEGLTDQLKNSFAGQRETSKQEYRILQKSTTDNASNNANSASANNVDVNDIKQNISERGRTAVDNRTESVRQQAKNANDRVEAAKQQGSTQLNNRAESVHQQTQNANGRIESARQQSQNANNRVEAAKQQLQNANTKQPQSNSVDAWRKQSQSSQNSN